jgi:hydroxymethylpyrimidine kinase/phosphomethylpyrimidine kinase
MTNTKKPVCLTIAGLDPSGGAGVIADVKTFTAFGCFAAAAVTSLTFQNTTGVFGSVHQTPDTVARQIDAVLDDYDVAAVKTGMLPTGEIIDRVADIIKKRELRNIVVDPVVRSTSGFDLIDDAALRALIGKLFPFADLVTPNLLEAERITGITIKSADDIQRAASLMRSMGARNVLIKGGHLLKGEAERRKAKAVDRLFVDGQLFEFSSEYIDTTATHGTGCVLSSAIAANLALGKGLRESVQTAKDFVTNAIRTAPMLGHGHSPINI